MTLDELKEIVLSGDKVSLEDFRLLNDEEQCDLVNYCSELEGYTLNQKTLIEKYFNTMTILRDIDREFAIWNATSNRFNKLEDLVANRRKRLGLPELVEQIEEVKTPVIEEVVLAKEEKPNPLMELDLSEDDVLLLRKMLDEYKLIDKSNNIKMYNLLDVYEDKLQGEKRNTSFNLYNSILDEFEKFCNSQKIYKHEIVSIALLEFLKQFK